MNYYFGIQFKRISRWFEYLGVPPILGFVLSIALFIAASYFLFFKLAFAEWVYLLIAIYSLFELGNIPRAQLIKGMFLDPQFRKIRFIENCLVALPFALFLIVQLQIYLAIALVSLAVLLSLFELKSVFQKVIPTPFKKIPFESIIGFRKYFWFVLLCYGIGIQAVVVDNFNLGLFSLASIFFTTMSFYAKPEKIKFVWIFDCSINSFLGKKILQAIQAATILAIPSLLLLSISFYDRILLVLLIQLIGSLLVGAMILVKYSAYPYEINLPQGIFIVLSIWLPPMLLLVIPIFYIQSKKRLKEFLYD